MKHKRILSVFIMILFVFGLFSAFSFSVNAAGIISSTNKYTYIRMAPYWTAEVVDELTSGYRITVIERDYSYFYIEYDKGGITKRGYLPLADSNVTGYSWCNHGIFLPGHNNTTAAVTVRYKPNSASSSCGTIDADEGEVSSKPLLVLREEDNFYFVQYSTNTTATGSTQPLYKRGWVAKSTIVVDTVSAAPIPYISGSQYVLICNTSTKYLTANTDNTISFQNANNSNNQHWILQRLSYTYSNNNSIYYRIVSASNGTCLTISNGTAIIGNTVTLTAPSTSPNKGQEFALETLNANQDMDSDQPYGKGVRILTRCSGNFLTIKNNSGQFIQSRKESTVNNYFFIDTMNYYWPKVYSSGSRTLKYNISSSAIFGNITLSMANTSFSSWNNIANINLVSNSQESGSTIKLKGYNCGTVNARMCPRLTSGGTEAFRTISDSEVLQTWYDATIYLNNGNNSQGYIGGETASDLKKTITHEIGHALKLKHPHTITDSNNNTYSIRYVYSVMHQGLASRYSEITTIPSAFDRRNLITKWGN